MSGIAENGLAAAAVLSVLPLKSGEASAVRPTLVSFTLVARQGSLCQILATDFITFGEAANLTMLCWASGDPDPRSHTKEFASLSPGDIRQRLGRAVPRGERCHSDHEKK
jgi:hypothetical protein